VEQIFSFFTLNTLSSITLGAIFKTYAMKLPALFDANLHTSEQKVLPYQKNTITKSKQPFCDIYALLAFYAAYSGSLLPIFRGNLSVPSSKLKHSSGQEVQDGLTLEDGPIGCPKTSAVTHYHSTLRKIPEDGLSHFTPRWKPAITQPLCAYLASSTGKTNMVLEGGYMSNDKLPNRVSNYVSGSKFNKSFPQKSMGTSIKIAVYNLWQYTVQLSCLQQPG
jgi:hypothetical protein